MKKFKPVTPSLRSTRLLDYLSENLILKKRKPLNKKRINFSASGGRNARGVITIRNRGGGHKKNLKFINSIPVALSEGLVESLEYSAFHTAILARIYVLKSKTRFYVIASKDLVVGKLMSINLQQYKIGNFLPLLFFPLSSIGFCLFVNKFRVASSAGCFVRVLKKGRFFTLVQYPSGKKQYFDSLATVCVGRTSNIKNNKKILGKAGRKIWLGKRPKVRGVAKNPIDHPHGGGEGKTSGGRPSVTPWGKPTHNKPTRKKSKKQLFIL